MGVSVLLFLSALPALGNESPLPGGRFFDDDGSVHEGFIEAIAAAGVTRGCNPPANDLFCPDRSVTRGEMAALLTRAMTLPASEDRFVDDEDSPYEAEINALAAVGITRGCNPPHGDSYCPTRPLSRGEAAAFLVRAYGLQTVSGVNIFTDDDQSEFEGDVEAISKAGLARGCNPPWNDHFCPTRPLTRAEAATLLGRAEGLIAASPANPFTGRLALSLSSGLIGPFGGISIQEGTRLPVPLIDDSVGMAALSPAGGSIAYVDTRRDCPPGAEGPGDCYQRLFMTAWAGGGETQLLADAIAAASPTWSPDGRRLAFVEGDRTSGDQFLSVLDLEAGALERLVGPGAFGDVSWSTAGLLAYEQWTETEAWEIQVRYPSGESAGPGLPGRSPRWSPNGQSMAYIRDSPAGGTGELLVRDWSAGSEQFVIEVPNEAGLAWSPDGAVIAFTDANGIVVAQPLDGGHSWPLTPAGIGVADVSWAGNAP